MKTRHTCDACGMEIEICEDCGGYICADGCPDRIADGCECGMAEDDEMADDDGGI